MRKRIIVIVIVLVLTSIGAGVAIWRLTLEAAEEGPGSLLLYGNVDIREVDLAANARQRILRMDVEEGERVNAGQTLAVLDTRRLAASVERARAMVGAQEALVARLVAGSRPEELRKARQDVAEAEAVLRDAKADFERTRKLVANGSSSKETLDEATRALDVATARLEATRATLALVEEGPRKEDIDAARANFEARKAELELARHELDDATLHAPADGIIRDRLLEPGDMAAPDRPLYTLALTDPLWVRVYVREADLGRIRPGMTAEVRTDSFPGKRYEGWVGFVSPTAEFTPKTVETEDLRTRLVYQVRVWVPNPENELRLGMPATVRVPLDQPETAPRKRTEGTKATK